MKGSGAMTALRDNLIQAIKKGYEPYLDFDLAIADNVVDSFLPIITEYVEEAIKQENIRRYEENLLDDFGNVYRYFGHSCLVNKLKKLKKIDEGVSDES
jgi:hypothetical protein